MGELLARFETQLASLTVVPSDGGRFEASLDGELIYSKLATRRHDQVEE
jgi:selenoprotein W-related protein